MEDLTGKQFGPYRIMAPLGEGGMAAVYKAFQPGVDRMVALKVLPQHFAKDPQFVDRFEREAKVLARLQHPHILPVHDFGQADGYTYIVMPFIDSGDLADLMKERRFSMAESGRIVTQVGDALDYAHSQGIVHRDVKPSNILVDQRGNTLLTDFGLAKIVSGCANKLTGSGFIIGTPEYMSPEQCMSEEVDGRSDIYAVGVILYELVTGRVPFSAETPVALIFKHINDPLPPPRQIDPGISEAVEKVILKAMAKEPADRYATAGEMTRALQAALETGVLATPGPETDRTVILPDTPLSPAMPSKVTAAPAKTADPGFNRVALWGLGSLAAVVLIGVLAFGGWFIRGSRTIRTSGPADIPPPAPTEPLVQPTVALPSPTPTQPVQVEPTPVLTPVVPPTAPPLPTEQPELAPPSPVGQPELAPPPPSDSGPPPPPDHHGGPPGPVQAAFDVCQEAEPGQACMFTSPSGERNGTCRLILNRLVCVPLGGPLSP